MVLLSWQESPSVKVAACVDTTRACPTACRFSRCHNTRHESQCRTRHSFCPRHRYRRPERCVTRRRPARSHHARRAAQPGQARHRRQGRPGGICAVFAGAGRAHHPGQPVAGRSAPAVAARARSGPLAAAGHHVGGAGGGLCKPPYYRSAPGRSAVAVADRHCGVEPAGLRLVAAAWRVAFGQAAAPRHRALAAYAR